MLNAEAMMLGVARSPRNSASRPPQTKTMGTIAGHIVDVCPGIMILTVRMENSHRPEMTTAMTRSHVVQRDSAPREFSTIGPLLFDEENNIARRKKQGGSDRASLAMPIEAVVDPG
jgi:hypothetical protein